MTLIKNNAAFALLSLPYVEASLAKQPFDLSIVKAYAAEEGFCKGAVALAFNDNLSLYLSSLSEAVLYKVYQDSPNRDQGVSRFLQQQLLGRFTLFCDYPRTFAYLIKHFAHPARILLGQKEALSHIDFLWRKAGDQTADFNYYSKRGLLLAIYNSSVLFWLKVHKRPNAYDLTKSFLENRFNDVGKIHRLKHRLRKLKPPFF